MSVRSLESFQRRVSLGLTVLAAYLLLLLGIALFTHWQAHQRLEQETAHRARSAARALTAESPVAMRASLREWSRGGAPRKPAIPRDLASDFSIVSAELLSPSGWSIDARSGVPGSGGNSRPTFTEAEARRLAAGEALVDHSGLAADPVYATVAAWHPILDDDARLLGVLRVEVAAEPLALSRRRPLQILLVQGGSSLAFAGLLVLFARWALRPLRLLEEARTTPEGPGDELSRRDDTGFVVETYRRAIDQLREKETELRRLREVERDRADELQDLNASIVDSMLSGVIVLDLSGAVRTMNDVARDILDVRRDERVASRPFAEVLRAAPELHGRIAACLERGEAHARDEVRLGLPGIGRRDLGLSVSPLRGRDGEQRGALVVLVDLTEVKRLQELVRLKENMAELGELSAGVAHEFRNSLAAILGYARLVEKQGGDEVREHGRAIALECGDLRKVVDDFLRFANPTRLVVETVDLAGIMGDLAEDVRSRAAAANKTVRYELADGLPVLSGDETLLRRAFTNLVRNACDAVGSGGLVRVSCERGAREVSIHIDDDGPGIPADERQRVFVPFFSRKEHGTGLGLALARKVVVHHGGRIVADASPLGGARLTVTLPLRPG